MEILRFDNSISQNQEFRERCEKYEQNYPYVATSSTSPPFGKMGTNLNDGLSGHPLALILAKLQGILRPLNPLRWAV